MNPVFTNTNKEGFKGYLYNDFTTKFDAICEEHLQNGKAQTFAFIIYDFHSPVHEVLEKQGAFTELDRLSGKLMTIFYLWGNKNEGLTQSRKLFKNLNTVINELTGQRAKNIPFVVFFDFENGEVKNVECFNIREDTEFVLHDLVEAIKRRLSVIKNSKRKLETSLFKTIGKVVEKTPGIVYEKFYRTFI